MRIKLKRILIFTIIIMIFCFIANDSLLFAYDDRPWPAGIQAIFDGEAPMLCPLPQKVNWNAESIDLSKGIILIKDFPQNRRLEKAVANWASKLENKKFPFIKIQNSSQKLKSSKFVTLLLTLDEQSFSQNSFNAAPLEVQKTEGYILEISLSGIILKGGGYAGLFYGLETLSQMIQQNNNSWHIRCGEIYDWPHKSYRGLHVMMPGRNDLPFYHDLIDYMAELKYNRLIIEVAGGMEYKKHPEINKGWEDFINMVFKYPGGADAVQESQGRPKNAIHHALGGGSFITQDEVRELIQYAKNRFIKVFPEIPSLSHSDYLLANHKELAENQNDPYPDTYCPSNPASYELLFDVIDEVVDVFQPEYVHIGHDEAYTFAMCDRCKGKSAVDLFAGDVIKIHSYLTDRGIKVMMWADKFLNIPGAIGVRYGGIEKRWPNRKKGGEWFMPEVYPAIDKIPRDILMVDWYHTLSPYTQNYFGEKGFQVIFGNFTYDMNQWEYRSRISNVFGGFVSNWTVTKEYGFAHDGNLYSHIFSSNLLWWGSYKNNKSDSIQKLLQKAVRHFRNHFSHNLYPSMQNMSAKYNTVDLSQYANLPICGDLSISRKYDFSGIGKGKNSFNNIPILLPSCENNEPVLFSVGSENDSLSNSIKLNFKAASLCLVHTIVDAGAATFIGMEKNFTPEQEILGNYCIEYRDGSTENIPLRYRVNIFDFIGPCLIPYYYADLIIQNPLPKNLWGQYNRRYHRENVFMYEWINPFPEKEIDNITLTNSDLQKKCQIFLLGLTGIELSKWEPDTQNILQRNQFIINGVENEKILSTPKVTSH